MSEEKTQHLLEALQDFLQRLTAMDEYDAVGVVQAEAVALQLRIGEALWPDPPCCRSGCRSLGVEQSGDGVRWYCQRHWKEAIHEGDPSR